MTGEPNNGQGWRGFQEPNTSASEFNAQAFVIQSLINRIATTTLVKVMAVTNDGGLSAVGFVDIMPLVNQIDGAGNATAHGTIYTCPYFRLQGGSNAIILDPVVGDIGLAVFADHDISSVTANKGQANPGSRRRFDMADALYIGGVLNGVPVQYVQFAADGIKVVSPLKVTIEAPEIDLNATTKVVITTPLAEIDAATSITLSSPTIVLDGAIVQGMGTHGGGASMLGPLAVTNDVTAEGTSLHTHTHGGVQTGSGDTGTPI